MRRMLVGFVLAALVAALFMPARAAPEPSHTNGHSENPVESYQFLGLVPLPEGRFLQLVLITRSDGVWLLVVLGGPNGRQGVVMAW